MSRKHRRLPPILAGLHERGVSSYDEFEAWLARRGWAWQQLARGELGFGLDEAALAFVHSDPVRWACAYLVEPDTGEPYGFFDYQVESIRAWRQDVIHADGAEVGKTREIIALILWAECTACGGTVPNPWILVAAPQQTHLDEIILAVEEQVGAADGQSTSSPLRHFWLKPKKTPHTMHRFRSPNPRRPERPSIGRVYYRPAGHDGEAFRGVHVNAFGIVDEAAKMKNPLHWSEFWRALKPGCHKRVYSVPDGDRNTEFYRMKQRARVNLKPGKPGFRLFNWPKTLMPPPFWSDERDRELRELYGGAQSPGYMRNVLGLDGPKSDAIWPWALLLQNVQDLPDYRTLRLRLDHDSRQLMVETYQVQLHRAQGKLSSQRNYLADYSLPAQGFDGDDCSRRAAMRQLVAEQVPKPATTGVLWAGCDLGESHDPTEIIISEQVGDRLLDVVRIRAAGLGYALQKELIYCLDEWLGFRAFWGVDLGSAGTAVVKDLQQLDLYADGHYSERLTGFQFAGVVECIDEQGNTLYEHDARGQERPMKAPAKHWATQMISSRMQRTGYGLAYDPDVLDQYANHTARAGVKWPIYDKKDDHAIDARRQQMLRLLFNEPQAAPDYFSTSAIRRSA